MENKAFKNLKVNPKFRNFKKRGTCFVLAGLMTASLCGQARAMEQTLSEGQTTSLMSTTQNKLYNVSRVAKFGANVNINDKSAMPVDANGNEVFPFFDNATETNYFPIRALAIFLNVDIRWDDATQTVVVDTSKGANLTDNAPYRTPTKLTAGTFIGQGGIKVTIDGVSFIPKNQKGQVLDIYISDKWTVYAPGRALCEALGVLVNYDDGPNHDQMNIYFGTHVAIEDPMGGYLLPGQSGYVYPDENGSVVSLEARYMQIYNLLKKVNALVDEKQHLTTVVVDECFTYYEQYNECLNGGNPWVQKYIDQTESLGYELQAISDSMEPGTQEKIVWGKYDSFANSIQTNPGSNKAASVAASIIVVEQSTQESFDRINLFNPSMAESYKAKFTTIYNSFLQEKSLHAYTSAYTLKP